jgi:hypothetical protein
MERLETATRIEAPLVTVMSIDDEEYFKADPELFGNWMSRDSMKRHDDFTDELKESLMTQEELEAKKKL